MRADPDGAAERAEDRRATTARSLREAVEQSAIAMFPTSARERLVRDGRLLDLPAGTIVHREGDAPSASLLVTGLVRSFRSASDGREVTLRYSRPGYALGLSTVAAGTFGASVQTLTPCTLLALPTPVLEELAASDAAVAIAIARWTAQLLGETADRLVYMWRPLHERVALALLDLARPDRDGQLIAGVSQQELANTTGGVRESVARILRELRSAGVVETRHGRVMIVRPDALLPSAPPTLSAG